MAEVIIGTGRHKALAEIVAMIDNHLSSTQGLPRSIHARSANVEIVAERKDFEAPYNGFTLRFRADGAEVEALKQTAQSFGKECSTVDDNGWTVFRFPPAGAEPSEQSIEAASAIAAAADLPEVWRIRGEGYRIDPISPELLFKAMLKYKASDVHLTPGEAPVFRVDGMTCHSEILGSLSAVQIHDLIERLADALSWEEFERTKQASFNYHQAGLGYARVSAFIKNGAPHCTFRFLPEIIPSFEDLHIPSETMVRLASLHHGLVLVTGMTGSGKTTTAAALIDYINANHTEHIITIENPVEYVHKNKKAIVSQRGLGADVNTFYEAVTGALRHDPDVILIGEMRDPDTIRSAINAAATGHLVISTLHSNTASEVVNRVVSFFDPVERDLVKLQLRDCIRAIICQRLVPKVGGGRIPALEMLFNDTKPITDGIVLGDTDMIRIGMQQTVGASFLFETYLHRMYKKGDVTLENVRLFCTDQSIFDQMFMGTYSVPRLDTIKGMRDPTHGSSHG